MTDDTKCLHHELVPCSPEWRKKMRSLHKALPNHLQTFYPANWLGDEEKAAFAFLRGAIKSFSPMLDMLDRIADVQELIQISQDESFHRCIACAARTKNYDKLATIVHRDNCWAAILKGWRREEPHADT